VSFYLYYYATARQICRLHYSAGSLTFVQTILKRLADAGYLRRLFLPRPARGGSAPSIYTLDRRGLNYLASVGYDVSRRYRPSDEHAHSYLFLSHSLAVTDVLISAALLSSDAPQITIATMLHERDLKRRPIRARDRDGKEIAVIPDGFLKFTVSGPAGEPLGFAAALEIDMGTTEQAAYRRKVRGLVRANQGAFQKAFAVPMVTVAVLAIPGEARRTQLVRWTQAELQALGQRAEADLFRFTSMDPASAEPKAMFLGPGWYKPFDEQAVPLIQL
jgi:hypothetical protein